MIPYELIIPSASRPHLLERTLATFFVHSGQWPGRVIVHNDGVFPGKRERVERLLVTQIPAQIPVVFQHDEHPMRHGPALKWLLDQVRTEYVVYTQDDFATVRRLPISRALGVLHLNDLNQIRFNKRKTMAVKGEGDHTFTKVEKVFSLPDDYGVGVDFPSTPCPSGVHLKYCDYGSGIHQTLCVADHWYFQTGVWRVAAIKPVVDWWMTSGPGEFGEHSESKINDAFNGKYRGVKDFPASVPVCSPEEWNDPRVRATVHKTFIWGPVREPRFVEHLGHDSKDWALERANRG